MEKLIRDETDAHIWYTMGHTRWSFDKRDNSRLQEIFDCLYDYQSTGLEPRAFQAAIQEPEDVAAIKSELETAKEAICQMCRKRGEEQRILCACVSCKYEGKQHGT